MFKSTTARKGRWNDTSKRNYSILEREHSAAAVIRQKAFCQMCHALARENGGAVTAVDTDTAARNFYSAKLSRYDQSVFLLQNIHYPYAAFAQRDASGRFVLTQQPEWLQRPESPVQFLSFDKLNQDWHSLRGELSPEELEQIHYWEPQTVGRSYLTLGTDRKTGRWIILSLTRLMISFRKNDIIYALINLHFCRPPRSRERRGRLQPSSCPARVLPGVKFKGVGVYCLVAISPPFFGAQPAPVQPRLIIHNSLPSKAILQSSWVWP